MAKKPSLAIQIKAAIANADDAEGSRITAIIKSFLPGIGHDAACELAGKFRFAAGSLIEATARKEFGSPLIAGGSGNQMLATEHIAEVILEVALHELLETKLFE